MMDAMYTTHIILMPAKYYKPQYIALKTANNTCACHTYVGKESNYHDSTSQKLSDILPREPPILLRFL